MRTIVLIAALLGSVPVGPQASAQVPSESLEPVIDLHVHAGAGRVGSPFYEVQEGETPDEAFLRSALADLDTNGVVLAIVGGPAIHAERFRAAAPDRFLGAVAFPCTGGLDPNLQPCFESGGDWPDLGWLRAEAEAGRVSALGELYNVYAGVPVGGPEMAPYLALAAELDLVVLAHADAGPPPEGRTPGCCPSFDGSLGDPAHWRPVLERHPDLRLVLYHAFRPEYVESALALMDAYPNVMVETSPMTRVPAPLVHAALSRFVNAGHGDRIVFGSDYPGAVGGSLAVIRAAPLSEAQQRAILFDNAARFLRLDVGKPEGQGGR